jgi:hypothetical protein
MQFVVDEVNKMNERIQELWKRAGGHYDSGNQHTWPQYTIDDPAKFAELIIQECLTICEELGDKGMDGHYCADEISKTFRS